MDHSYQKAETEYAENLKDPGPRPTHPVNTPPDACDEACPSPERERCRIGETVDLSGDLQSTAVLAVNLHLRQAQSGFSQACANLEQAEGLFWRVVRQAYPALDDFELSYKPEVNKVVILAKKWRKP